MFTARILGEPANSTSVSWLGAVAATTLLFRLAYPAAALAFASAHGATALVVIIASLVLAVFRAVSIDRATRVVRGAAYRALRRAIERYPLFPGPGAPPPEQIENEISRGVPWLEAYVALTLPALAGEALATLAIAALGGWLLGLRVAALGAIGVILVVIVSRLAAGAASRAASAAWDDYQHVAKLIETGIRGRAELRAHALTSIQGEHLTAAVHDWSVKERRAHMLAALTGWTVPLVVAASLFGIATSLGLDPLRFAFPMGSEPTRAVVSAGLIGVSALAAVTGLARGISNVASERPYVVALHRFIESAAPPRAVAAIDPSTIREIILQRAEYQFPGSAERLRVDLTWNPGERLAVMGPNGCGKTTLSLLLLGLLRPSSGSAWARTAAGDVPLEALPGRVAYLPQQPYFSDADTVLSAIQFAAPQATLDDVCEILIKLWPQQSVDASQLVGQRVQSLSAGERRTVALARVLLRRAALTVLDEPEANLDTEARRRVLEVLGAYSSGRLLVLTHNEDFAALCDRTLRFSERLALCVK